MGDDKDRVDYMASINKARSRKRKPPYATYAAISVGCVLLFAGVVFGGKALIDRFSNTHTEITEEAIIPESKEVEAIALDPIVAAANEEEIKRLEDIQKVIDSYNNLGIVKVTGYLNMRENPKSDDTVVGKLMDGSACEILETLDGWHRVTSGGIEGYISSDYVLTGEEAVMAARELVMDRAVITADSLNVRKEPTTESDVIDRCLQGEKFEIIGETEGWYQIANGYISAEFAEREFSLNEARKLDLRAMVLSYYDNPGVSNVTNYLNIRQKPGKEEKIIGKLPSFAGCEILEEQDGWYKIRSGKILGYVSADYILTGDAAKEAAMQHAELMAVVSTDVLNARMEPTTESKIWTQITNSERYHVVEQLDGWVKIEFDESNDETGESTYAYVSTDYVDVRYALDEAIKFSPAEENASLRSRMVSYALKFLGNPYVWGGTSLTKGADCSGFTLSVYKQFGMSLPHYSGSQAQMGTAVKSSNMRPGDLIFYGNSSGTINHVAMYIGNGQVVHAASKRSGIKISSWNYRKPLKIRDIIGNRK